MAMGPKHLGPAPYYKGIRTSQEDTSPFRHGRRRKWGRDDSFATVVIWPVALILLCTCVLLQLGGFLFLLGLHGYIAVTVLMMGVVTLVGLKKRRRQPGKSLFRTVIVPVLITVAAAGALLALWLLPFLVTMEGTLTILGVVLAVTFLFRLTDWHKMKKKSRQSHLESVGTYIHEQQNSQQQLNERAQPDKEQDS
jgi:hypothetical protein